MVGGCSFYASPVDSNLGGVILTKEEAIMVPRPPNFGDMFKSGARYRWAGKTDSVQEVRSLGEISLPTGQLAVCDPLWGAQALVQVEPLAVFTDPGSYGVTLAVARWPEAADLFELSGMIAAAKVTITDTPVATWELARTRLTGEGPPHRLTVDSGVGCLLDFSAVGSLTKLNRRGGSIDQALTDISSRLSAKVVDPTTGLSVILFKCPMGDGDYPIWIGRDERLAVSCYIVHLSLLHNSLGPIK